MAISSRSPVQNFDNRRFWIRKNKYIIESIKKTKDLDETKYYFLIKEREDAGLKHFNDPKAFIGCSNTMENVYNNFDDYNPLRKRKVLLVFDYMIGDIMSNKNLQAAVNDLFFQMQKIKCFTCFCSTVLFLCSKRRYSRSTHYLTMKINSKGELKNITINLSTDFGYKDFMKTYRGCAKEPFRFLTIDATLPASDPLRFKKNLSLYFKNDSN